MSRSRAVSSVHSQHHQPDGDQLGRETVEPLDKLSEYEMEIERRVELCLKGARDKGLAVNRAMIQQFGVQSKADLLETDFLSDETKARVQHFEGGIKWCRNFMSRHGIRGTRAKGEAKGEAGSVKKNGSLRAPPRYSEISAQVGFLEEMAEACGIERAKEGIQMAKMAFLLASAT